MSNPDQIAKDPFWQHAYSHGHSGATLHDPANPQFVHTPIPPPP